MTLPELISGTVVVLLFGLVGWAFFGFIAPLWRRRAMPGPWLSARMNTESAIEIMRGVWTPFYLPSRAAGFVAYRQMQESPAGTVQSPWTG
ncbi:MAG: hypothetical protein AAF844_10715 [Pseudomonadota bacterium]